MASEPTAIDPATVARVTAALPDPDKAAPPSDSTLDELVDAQTNAAARTPVAYRRYLARLAPILRHRITAR